MNEKQQEFVGWSLVPVILGEVLALEQKLSGISSTGFNSPWS